MLIRLCHSTFTLLSKFIGQWAHLGLYRFVHLESFVKKLSVFTSIISAVQPINNCFFLYKKIEVSRYLHALVSLKTKVI
jgi:hypothetical protein